MKRRTSIWYKPLLTGLLLATLALAGCEGDDGSDGAAGAPGTPGAPGAPGTPGAPSEPGEDGATILSKAHVITGQAAVSNVAFAVSGADLVITYNLKINGAVATGSTIVDRDYRFDGTNRSDLGTVTTATDNGSGNYSVTVPGGAANAATNSRYLLRVANTAGTRALVMGDYPASPIVALVDSQACVNCHGTTGQGRLHYSYPLDGNVCVVCHEAANTTLPRLDVLAHGIHNSHNMPSGKFILVADDPATPLVNEEESFSATYPSYMNNCSVCHNSPSALATVNADPMSYDFCMSCHENWDGFAAEPASHTIANGYTSTKVCTTSTCHDGSIPNTAPGFHNGTLTERSGLIYEGQDVSVVEGAKVDMQITGVTYPTAATMAVTWTAAYNGVAVNPCNTTVAAGAPIFYAGGAADAITGKAAGNLSLLRAYGEGDDWTNADIGTSPGQPVSINLQGTGTIAATACVGNVATSTFTLTAAEQFTTLTKGVVALQGKAQVKLPYTFDLTSTPAVVEARDVIQVRSKTPTYQFVVNTGAADAARREIVDTEACLKCHVGSLYQHGGNRIDNVDMCVLCHNEASNEKNVRALDGITVAEAYDGKVGQTYGFKSLLHAVHSSGETGAITAIYRTFGVFVWAGEGVTPPNWPTVNSSGAPFNSGDPATVFGSLPAGTNPSGTTRNHTLYYPTYPRLLSDCSACHKAGTETLPNQAKAVATTVDAGAVNFTLASAGPPAVTASGSGTVAVNGNQLDDVLQGASAAACMSCHQSSDPAVQAGLRAHASQMGWAPQVFPNGRQDVLNFVEVETCNFCHK